MQDAPFSRWTLPSVILVATDLSDLDRLMPFAVGQAVQTGARLILLHTIAATEALNVDMAGMPYYDPAIVEESRGRILEFCCQTVRAKNIDCDGLVREGRAAQEILRAARQFHADRIVLGTRRSKLSKLLLGSVAEQVLRSANIPVITVGPEARLPVDGNTSEQVVLHATTLREASRPSAALACQIAALLHARLVIMHVLPPFDGTESRNPPSALNSAAVQELQALAAATSDGCSVLVEPRLVHGNPAIEILAESEHRYASLIVTGSTARSGFQNLTRDRTVYKVLAHAHCPVLTLPEAQVSPGDFTAARMAMRP